MTIIDEFGIFSIFFLEVVTLAYLINSQSVAANVDIFGNVSACTSQHLPSSFNPWLTRLKLPRGKPDSLPWTDWLGAQGRRCKKNKEKI